MRTNHYNGVSAEKFVITFLWSKSHKILSHRYKTPYGEIDIITQHQNTIHFIEVKYSTQLGSAINYINSKQKERIISAINFWISQNQDFQIKNLTYQIDAAIIYHGSSIVYIDNAWEEIIQ
jgi:putative endonuclease